MELLSRIFGKNKPAPKPRHGHNGMVSLVALLPSWEPRSLEAVRNDLDALFPGEFLPPRESGNFVINGPVADASYMVQCTVAGSAGMYLVHNVPGPYSEFSDFMARAADLTSQLDAADQHCWMSVDMIHCHTTEEEAFRFVATAMAKMAPADAAFLLHPGRQLWTRFTPQIRAVLASGGSPFVAA